jgi:carnitine-CoA ligase
MKVRFDMNDPRQPSEYCGPLWDLVGASQATVGQVLRARARATPEATFLIDQGRRHTFGEVLDRASRFAALVPQSQGAPRVMSFLTHGADAVTVMLGTHLGGGVFTSINRQLQGALLSDRLVRIRPTVLVTEASGVDALPVITPGVCERVLFTDHIPGDFRHSMAVPVGLLGRALETSPMVALPGIIPSQIASLIFTSGTTGSPKAVRISHNQLCRGAARLVEGFKLDAQDVIHAWPSLSHVSGQLYSVMAALVSGSALALYPTFSASRFWEQVNSVSATFIIGFANVAKILMESPAAAFDRHTLRLALLAGVTPAVAQSFEDRFGVRLVQAYGMTEADPLTVSRWDVKEPIGSVGRAAADFEIAVVDELDNPLPPGSVGRIVARPRAPFVMMDGYDGEPGATLDAYRNLWFHTQDLGWLDAEGYLFFADRLKNAIRRRGENISSLEIENVLRTHPGVAECAVVGVPSPLGEQDIKAVLAPAVHPPAITPAQMHAFCVAHLPRFMVPRYFELRASLPTTEVGKVRREELDGLGADVWDSEAAPA